MSQEILPLFGYQEDQLCELLDELCALPAETEWLEFKCNYQEPHLIGEYISALANSAALLGQPKAWLVWGIENTNRSVVGTTFSPRTTKGKGNEDLETWLMRLLDPRIHFTFHEFEKDKRHVIMLEIEACQYRPVRFDGIEYIRVGSHKSKLAQHPEKERKLWALLDKTPFEKGIALERVSADDVINLLDYPAYFEMSDRPLPEGRNGILERFVEDKCIIAQPKGKYDVTNLGAILFAKNLRHFETLERKRLRIIVNKGVNRIDPLYEYVENRGYAASLVHVRNYIDAQTPPNEHIGAALRKEQKMYPPVAIRELLVNALGHQDFSMKGTGPMVEIFSDRIEFSNPGLPLIDVLRFIDHSPLSRNESLASMMRLLRMCDERGSGIDRVIYNVELFQLPAPEFLKDSTHTRVILFAHRNSDQMDRQERMRACYQHACLMYLSRQNMSNTTVRRRFNIAEKNYAMATRIIRDTLDANLIKVADPDIKSPRLARYVPFWV